MGICFMCGYSLIDPTGILTASHCIQNKDAADLKACVGEWDASTSTEAYASKDISVTKTIGHPNYRDIVSLAHNVSFWGQKLNHNVSFWVQKLNHNVSFWAQKFIKWEKFLFEWIFLVSIELINNPKPVQIIFFFFYWLEFWKQIFEPETEP